MAAAQRSIPLFEVFPTLAERFPLVPHATLPTPVTPCETLASHLNAGSLHIKRDDQTGDIYGGNKVRKLEFLLGKAKADGVKTLITFGYAGSNHALATAIYGRQAGFRVVSMLLPQPNAHYVQRNLLAGHGVGADLRLYNSKKAIAAAVAVETGKTIMREGKAPMIIPPGGSSALGAVAFVNAAFELKNQIDGGELPKPDVLYLPLGSMGTAAGLLVGLAAAGIQCRVEAARVVGEDVANQEKLAGLVNDVSSLLRDTDPGFPQAHIDDCALSLRDDCFGEHYAQFTEAGMEAIELVREHTGIPLDGTYSGKAFSALIKDARQGALANKYVLFWNTHNSRNFSRLQHNDYRDLPKAFHRYFETDVQPLDRYPTLKPSQTRQNQKR